MAFKSKFMQERASSGGQFQSSFFQSGAHLDAAGASGLMSAAPQQATTTEAWQRATPAQTKIPETTPVQMPTKLKERESELVGQQEKMLKDAAKGIFMPVEQQDAIRNELNSVREQLKNYDYGALVNASDYQRYSQMGAAMENPTFDDVESALRLGPLKLGGSDPQNIVTYSRENADKLRVGEKAGRANVGSSRYQYMTDEEVGIYNYLLAKNGKKEADAYLDSLKETLNYRAGAQVAEGLKDTPAALKPVSYGLTALTSGMETGMSGIGNAALALTGTGDRAPTTSGQFTNQIVASDLAKDGKGLPYYAYSATNTVGNMLPSLIVGAVNPTAGLVTMGLGSGGNAYSEALQEGYSKEQATLYGICIGASEAGLEKLLGGISALRTGTSLSDRLLAKVSKFDNVLARVIFGSAIEVGSEITEEETQNVLEPILRSFIFGEEFEAPDGEQILETAIVTALSTLMMNAPGNVAQVKDDMAYRAEAKAADRAIDNAYKAMSEQGLFSPEAVQAREAANQALQQTQEQGRVTAFPRPAALQDDAGVATDGQNKSAPEMGTGNTRLTDADLDDYMATGKTLHTRNKKARLLEAGKSPILTSVDAVKSFIRDVITGNAAGEVRAYGRVGSRLADAIKQLHSGTDTYGKYIEINADDLRESYKQHHTPKEAGDIALSAEDFENIPDYLDAFDYVLSVENHNGKTRIHVAKEVPAGYVIMMEVDSGERNSLQVTKAFGVSAEKFEDKYGARIKRRNTREMWGETGHPERSNPSTTAPLTTDISSNRNIPQTAPESNPQFTEAEGASSRTVGPESSVGAAESGFDPYSHLQNQTDKFHPEGENPARQVDVPMKDFDGRNIPKSTATVMEAKATPDSAVGVIQDAIAAGEFSFDTITDKSAQRWAEGVVEAKGWQRAMEQFHDAASKGVVSKNNIALGQVLLNNAMNAGDNAAIVDILTDYSSMSTTAAQSMQAQRMLKKMAPDHQLYAIERSVKTIQNELTRKYGDKAPDLQVPTELVQQFREAETQEARDAVMEEIYKSIARQTPATLVDKWNAWRYLAMLGNPRTHVRNILGNAAFWPVRFVKNMVATGIETVTDAVVPGGIDRTKAQLNLFSEADRALVGEALKDVAKVEDALLGDGKYRDEGTGRIEDYRTIFKFKPLEGYRKFNGTALDVEDTWFSKPAYAGALAKYLKANGVSATALQDGTVDRKVLDSARAWAIQEAKKATYRDSNALSDAVSQLNRLNKSSNKVVRGLGTVVEGVLPFKKTPANILMRGVEYSPVGLLKGLTADLVSVRNGSMTAAQAIDDIAAGLTGTGLLALGAFLAAGGLVTGGGTGDDKQDAQDDLTGGQDYALSIGGSNFTLDWLAPEALPFFVGVELYNTLADQDGNGVTVDNVLSSVLRITDPMLEMSMLQGLQDAIENVKFSDSPLVAVPINAAVSYLTQALPTLFGQFERTAEDQRYTTYVDRTSGIPRDVQYTLGKVMNKLPGEFQQIPYIDAWGRTEETGSLPERAVNNFLNPAFTSKENVTEVDQELQRLYDAGQTGVFPSRVSQSTQISYTENGEKLRRYMTADEYVSYATTKGETSFEVAGAMMSSPLYQDLTDEEKASVIQLAFTYATHVAAEEVTDGKHESDAYVEKAQKAQEELGLSTADYLILKQLYGAAVGGDKIRDAYKLGIDPLDFLEYNATVKNYDDKGGTNLSIVERGDSIEASGMTEDEQLDLWRLYYPDWEDKAKGAGVDFNDLVQYKLITGRAGASKKDDKIDALVKAGYKRTQAEELYKKLK